jgi:uncharacterized protein YecE (DUF72 family)
VPRAERSTRRTTWKCSVLVARSVLEPGVVSPASTSAVARSPRIGCSGWNYKSWRGRFYPRHLPVAQWLEFYSARFDTVEINNSFYRLPERSTFERWRSQVPSTFLVAVKASRFLTHMKRLIEPEEPIARLFSSVDGLGRRLGPVLYQLPPTLEMDLPRLDRFLRALPRGPGKARLHVVEFRHPSWYTAETFELLTRRHAALCLHDKLGSRITQPMVGPFVYVRFHGTSGHYHGSYSRQHLDRWAHLLADQVLDGKPVFAYFNNDPDAVATVNAATLREMIEKFI